MKLEQIRPCFTYMSLEEQASFFQQYYERRSADLREALIVVPKGQKDPASRAKDRKISVTPEQLALLKKMGLV